MNKTIFLYSALFFIPLSSFGNKISSIDSLVIKEVFSLDSIKTQDVTQDVPQVKDTVKKETYVQKNYDLNEVVISEYKPNKYTNDSSVVVSKMPLKDLENPQVYTSLNSEILEEQQVSGINEALQNATGVTRLWESTGRGGDGGEYYSLRGFAVQPTMINGMPAMNNGAMNVANIESVEVIKGPSGTLYGSSLISYGGLINITTKKPYDEFGGSISSSISGRETALQADINTPLTDKVYMRIVTDVSSEDSFQDAGYNKSFFIAPSFKIKANDRLTFLINTEISTGESANAPMLFLNSYMPMSFNDMSLFDQNYYRSFTSNELTISTPTFNMQSQALYKLSDSWTSQTVISKGTTTTDGYYSYLWDQGDGNSFARYTSKQNGKTSSYDIQQNFLGEYSLFGKNNKIVVGLDYYNSSIQSNHSNYVANGVVTLKDGGDTGNLTKAGVDNLISTAPLAQGSTADSHSISAYFSNVIEITDKLSAMASLRVDNFSGSTAYWNTSEVSNETTFSPKLGVVYQPIKDKLSVFANYMNGFMYVAPSTIYDINGQNPQLKIFDPEQANQYELGVKLNLHERLSLTASYYDIMVKNVVMTDPNNINNFVQNGKINSKGYEISLSANPIQELNLIVGYSDNNAIVKEGDAAYKGLRPEEAGPEKVFNFWVNYTLSSTIFEGLGIGVGGNVVSSSDVINNNNTGTFTLPGYAVFNANISYSKDKYTISLDVDNFTDEMYYTGWATVSAQENRSVTLNFSYDF